MTARGARAPADVTLRVTLVAPGGAVRGTVEISRGASKTQRSVAGGRCEEVVEALALISALALSEHQAGSTDANAPQPPGRGRKSSREAARQTDARTRAGGADRVNPERADDRAGAAARNETALPDRAPEPRGTDPRDPESPPADSILARDAAKIPDSAAVAGREGATASTTRDTPPITGRDRASAPAGREGATASAARDTPAITGRDRASAPPGREGASASTTRDTPAITGREGEPASASTRKGGEAEGEQHAQAAAERGDASPRDRTDPERQPERQTDTTGTPLGVRVGADVLAFSGLAPALQPGLQLRAALTFSATWSLQLGARIASTHQVAAPSGDAWFRFTGGVVRICRSNALGSPIVALSGCAVAEPGVFSAGGENTLNRRSHSRLWLALGAAAGLSLRVVPWLGLRAGAELLMPVRRDRVLLAGDTLYHIPALGLRLYLGLEVPFE